MAKTTERAKPRVKKGVCRYCGCTDKKGCIVDRQGHTCQWMDHEHTRCSNCVYERALAQRMTARIEELKNRGLL